MINPYYDLTLPRIDFDRASGSCKFDIICFWATEDGRVYTAQDSGGVCPIPFADYVGETLDDVLTQLGWVDSVAQAESTFDAWNVKDGYNVYMDADDRHKLTEWVKKHLKS